jgi:ribosomal protein S11
MKKLKRRVAKRPVRKVKFMLSRRSGRNTACLVYSRSFTNITLTLTDLRSNVLITRTSGQAHTGRSSKIKKTPYSLEKIFRSLRSTFKRFKLKKIHIVAYCRTSKIFIRYLLKELAALKVFCISLRRKIYIPHNGVRIRKKPRK